MKRQNCTRSKAKTCVPGNTCHESCALHWHRSPASGPPLEVTADKEDLDRIGVGHAWRWSTPFLHLHAKGAYQA